MHEAVRKTVTVLFCDLVGSTSFGERVDAESAREAMATYHSMAREAIERSGGTLAKFIGDGVMALFGVPEIAEDDADRAVAAGLALQQGFGPIRVGVAARHGIDLGLRVGINTGEIVMADGDADLVGDPINTAARLEATCPTGDVLVGEETWRLTRARVRYEVLGEVHVKGKDEPVATFRVADDALIDDEVATPFVGRVDELSRLRAAFDESVANRSVRLVTVIGAPGVGKTRISREFCDSIADSASVVELRCERSGTATFAPIADLLRSVADVGDPPDEDHVVRKLRDLVDNLDDADRVAGLLASFVGAAAAPSTEEAFLAVRRLVESIGRREPLIVVVDDIQWAEPLFLDLLEHLAEWTDDSSAVIIGLARPELRELRPTLAEESRWLAAVIQLEGLDAAATAELAARLVGAETLPRELVERLPESTEGNPLFVRELMRMLVDDGVIEQAAHGWELAIDADAVEVPPTIQSLLATRLERMPADERRLLELASVVGPEFAVGAVAAIASGSGTDPPGLRSSLERLRRRELVEPTGTYWGDEPIYRFHHVLIRDAAYRRVVKRTRAELHLRVGEWTARTAATLVGEYEVAIAHHFEQAHEYRRQLDDVDDEITAIGHRAAELLRVAAERALGRDDLASAGTLAERALERLADADDAVPDLLLVACESLLGLGDVTRGRPRVERLEMIAVGDERRSAWADCFVAQLAVLTDPGRLHEVERTVDAAAQRLARLGDEAGVAKARLVRAGALARLGRVGECEAELDIALTAARSAGDRRRVTAVLGAAPVAALWGPSPIPRAGGRCLDVIRLLRITTGSPAVEATSIRCQAVLEALRGRFDTARSMLADARATVEELGLPHALGETDLYAGIVELLAGDPVAAEVPLRGAYQRLGRLGVGADVGQAAAYLARALLQQGRLDEADEFAADSNALAGQNPQTAIAARAAQAEILAARGLLADAVARAAEAVELASGTDIVVDHANANAVLARVARLAGDEQLANRAAAAAADLFEQKAAAIDLGSTRASRSHTEPVSGVPAAESDADPDDAAARTGPLRTRAADLADEATAALARRDAHWAALLSEDVVLDDRRQLARRVDEGRDAVVDAWLDHPLLPGFIEQSCEVLAVRGDDLVLIRNTARTSGPDGSPEMTLLAVLDFDEHDRLRRGVLFDPRDLRAAVDELDRLYLEGAIDPAVAVTVAGWATTYRLISERDIDGYLATMSSDLELVDHRPLGWGTTGIVGLRERSTSLFELDGELVSYVRWFASKKAAAAQMVWSTHALVRPSGADHVDDHLLVAGFDPASGFVKVIHQFGADQLAAAMDVFEAMSVAVSIDLLNAAAIVAGGVHTQARAGHGDLVRRWCSDELRIIGTDGEPVVIRADDLADPAALRRVGLGVARRNVMAVRGDRLALVRLSDDTAGGEQRHSIAIEELDDRGRLASITLFVHDTASLCDAVDLLEDRWAQIDGRPVGRHEPVPWKLARAFRREDEAMLRECLADECVMVDRRQIGWPALTKEEWIGLVGQGAGRRGVFLPRQVLRMDASGYAIDAVNLSLSPHGETVEMLRQVGIGVIANGRVAHVEAFEPEDRAVALARLDELTGPPVDVVGEPWNQADRLTRQLIDSFLDRSSDAWLEMLDAVSESRSIWTRVLVDDHMSSSVQTIATRGETLVLHRWTVGRGQGGGAWDTLLVTRWNARGCVDLDIRFDLDDLASAIAELDRLYLDDPDHDPLEAFQIGVWAAGYGSLAAGDIDGTMDFLAPSYVQVDHRSIGWPTVDRAGMRERLATMVSAGERHPFVARVHRINGRLILCQAEVRVTGEHGAEQIDRHLVVGAMDDAGLLERVDQYSLDQHSDAVARFEELVAEEAARDVVWNLASLIGGRVSHWYKEGRDERVAEATAEGVAPVVADARRVLGIQGHRVALVELTGNDVDGRPVHAFAVEEIDHHARLSSVASFPVDRDGLDRALALSGAADGELVVQDGLLLDREFFPGGDADAALAGFDESGRRAADHEPWNEADRLARRLVRLFVDTLSEAWLEMLDPDIVAVDRRPLIGSTVIGREAHRIAWKRNLGDREFTSTVETVAARGDRLALHRWRLGVVDGGLSWDLLRITRWNDRDLVDHSVGFAPDELAAAVAELDRLYLEEAEDSFAGDAQRVFVLAGDSLAAGDVDGYLMYSDPSFVMVDHRQIGWPELDLAGMRTRLESIVEMPGEVFILQERILRLDPTWSACWTQRMVFSLPDGVEQVQRSVMVMVFDPQSGLISRVEQFDENGVDEALVRFDELIGQRGEVLTNRAWRGWQVAHLWHRHDRYDLISGSFAADAVYLDELGETIEPFRVDDASLIGVRGELLALVELRGVDAAGVAAHRFAVEEIEERGVLRSITTFPADEGGLVGAANLFDQRWGELEGWPSVVTAAVMWNRADRAPDVDAMLTASQPDLELVDHRPIGFLNMDRESIASVWERPDLEHGVILGDRVVALNQRGLVARVGQWRFDVDGEVSLMIPSYCVVTARDGLIDRFEFFPDDDPSPAIARLDELTRSSGLDDADPLNDA